MPYMRKLSWLLLVVLAATVINYPNPFNPQGGEITTIECTADTTAEAFLYIYDMAACRILRTAFNQTGGTTNQITWNGYSGYNNLVGNGVYLYWIVDTSRNRIGRGKIWVVNQ